MLTSIKALIIKMCVLKLHIVHIAIVPVTVDNDTVISLTAYQGSVYNTGLADPIMFYNIR